MSFICFLEKIFKHNSNIEGKKQRKKKYRNKIVMCGYVLSTNIPALPVK